MPGADHNNFTKDERAAIYDRITALEKMRLLGGEATSFDKSGGESIQVMPLDDGLPRYVITKRGGQFHIVDSNGANVVTSNRLDDVLDVLP